MRQLLPAATLVLSAFAFQSCSESTTPGPSNDAMIIAYTQLDQGAPDARIPHAIIADSNGALLKDLGIGQVMSIGAGQLMVVLNDTAAKNFKAYIGDKMGNVITNLVAPEELNGASASAKGKRIAWGFRDASSAEGILIRNFDGSDSHVITEHLAHETTYSFSPNGDRIAFIQVVDEKYQVCVANVDGTNLKVIEEIASTSPDGYDGVTWSPVGEQLVYRNNRIVHHHDLSTGVTTTLERAELPSFTADGIGITYTAGTGADIFLTKDLGVTKVNLTNTPDRAEAYPSWSPDGTKMLFLHWAGDFDQTTGSLGVLDLSTDQMTTIATPAYVGYFVK